MQSYLNELPFGAIVYQSLSLSLQFGDYPTACPMMAFLQPISIFVSTLSITAIALDRRRLIICPHEPPYQSSTILGMVPGVWVTAILLASPMAAFKKLESWTQFPQAMDELRWASNNAKVIFLSTFYTDQPRLNINKKFRKFHINQNGLIHLPD